MINANDLPAVGSTPPPADQVSVLKVEDGSLVAGAESYLTPAEADQYHAGRGNTAWANLSLVDKERKLRLATDYLTQTYRGRWRGSRVRFNQALDWPRQGVVLDGGEGIKTGASFDYLIPFDKVPGEVKNACAELALRAISGPLLKDLGQGVKMVKAGPVVKEYDTNSSRHVQYSAVDRILEPLMADISSSGGSSLKITRC